MRHAAEESQPVKFFTKGRLALNVDIKVVLISSIRSQRKACRVDSEERTDSSLDFATAKFVVVRTVAILSLPNVLEFVEINFA